jgi:CheY-like chemotaxis protein/anti-sigma regulatory factor (Ser/Thr protein kinase)
VRAEERRLVQVLVNLLVNAAQAIPEGHVDENEIRVVTRDEEDGTVSIEVWDTGVGLPKGDVSKLFEPFFTTRGDVAGTGLGLSTSHRIITSFGGSLHARRRPDRGSIFQISLPPATSETSAVVADPCTRPETRQLRVLLVEDERALAETMRMLLEPHIVAVEHSGNAAIERLAKEAGFDVVVCDLQMPSGGGAEVYEHARLTKPGLEQRFIFMTGGVFTDQARAFMRGCSQPVLEKPFTSDELHRALALVGK